MDLAVFNRINVALLFCLLVILNVHATSSVDVTTMVSLDPTTTTSMATSTRTAIAIQVLSGSEATTTSALLPPGTSAEIPSVSETASISSTPSATASSTASATASSIASVSTTTATVTAALKILPSVTEETASSTASGSINTITVTMVSDSTTTDTMQVHVDITMVLWIVLGCLIALIIATLCAICLVSVAHCRHRYKRKKKPTALDIISKWEDTPNESSDIQLLSMKAVEEGESKDGEEKNDDRVEEKEEGKVDADEKSDKVEVKESKEDDVTVGTFGFAEKAVKLASIEQKAESPTGPEQNEDENKKGEAMKEGENEKLVEVTIEKAGEESTTDTGGSGRNSAPNNRSTTGTDTTAPTEKEKAQEGTKPEPVPVQIPIIGQQVADVKALDVKHAADSEVKTSEHSNKPASPSKAQGQKSETSLSSSQDVSATESVSKEPEPAATITRPQTEAVSLASDKPPSASAATGGLSLFTNEDMEKALGVAANKDLGQVESTQL